MFQQGKQYSVMETVVGRRQLLKAGATGIALLALAPLMVRPAYASLLSSEVRKLSLTNMHTGEACALTYWEDGDYITEALEQANHLLRDHRNNEVHAIDPALLDLLAALHGKLETNQPFQVISGYRSPASNALLHARSSGVATKSLHMVGKAMDIRIQGRGLAEVHRTAIAMGLGGVGYYPSSNFVHVDTGRVRQWAGS